MAETLVSVTGTNITHDETAGLQNSVATPAPAGDADDDDVLFSSIPSVFSTRLGQVTGATPIGAAASPGNVVTFSPTGTLGNIALTDANGQPLDGDDSGLVTTDGEAILLFTDTNDNIVLGKTASGAVVFAIYLEETGGTPPTGGKLWTVQYEAIDHGADGNDHDSAVDLTGLVHVTAFEAQDFSFDNAPSGQNLFMMFGTTSQAILVTGEDPANESAGQNVSNDGDTVNTGQGGGATTLGTEGQQMKAQKALVVTFVSGANSNFLVPNLSPTEANDETNIAFNGYVGARAAEFTISQMTPGGPSTTATVEIAAYVTADGTGDAYIDNNPIVQGDAAINITTGSVQVIRGGVNVVGTQGVTVNYTGDTAVITGVKDDDVIRYATDTNHNRVLIRNDQPASGSGSNVSFDLGGFTLTEVSGDTDEVGSNIFFEDDGPSIATGTNPTALTVDETTLGTDASGSFASLFNVAFGTDGQASAGALTYALGIGVVGADSGLDDSATGNSVFLFLSGGGTTITGKEGTNPADAANGDTVFVISVNAATGVVTLDQQRAVIHTPDTGPDQAVSLADGVITLTATATDGDTDTASRTENIGDRFTFEDDAPAAGANTAKQLDDETAQATLATPNLGGAGDATGTSATVTGTLAHTYGADGAGTVLLTAATLPASGGFSQTLSADKSTLTISQVQNGASVDVVRIEVTNVATGAYTVTHLNQVFHPTPGTTEEDVTFTVNYQVTDKDGDTANSSVDVLVDDDTPTVAAGTNPAALTVDETILATNASGSFASLFSASFGADGQASTGALTFALGIGAGGPNSGLVDTATGAAVVLSGGGTTITGRAGSAGPIVFVISVDASTGVVTLDQQRAVVHPDETNPDDSLTLADNVITLTATAKDGDLDTAGHTENVGDRFTFKDDGPAITVGDTTGNYSAGAQGSWDHGPGADGFQSLGVTFDSYEIDAHGSQTTNATNSSFTQTGAFSFEGSITDDFNGDGTDDTVEFTLTFDPDDPETYDLQVTVPPSQVIVKDTTDGTLKAGGPDPVRTLLFGGTPPSEGGLDDVVFFGVVATAPTSGQAGNTPPNDLLDLIVSGATDLTEDQIQAFLTPTNQIPTLINSATQMNVSTAGIGVNNNNLDGATLGLQASDESFVFNPEEVVDTVTVYIDNSVGGYTPASEDLFYTVYYTDGTTSGPTDVTSVTPVPRGNDPQDLIPDVAEGGSSFVIDGGAKQIDAVQLTMQRGTIKIPVIQWTIEQEFNPEPLQLDFTATLLDGDDDSATDTFSIDLGVDTLV